MIQVLLKCHIHQPADHTLLLAVTSIFQLMCCQIWYLWLQLCTLLTDWVVFQCKLHYPRLLIWRSLYFSFSINFSFSFTEINNFSISSSVHYQHNTSNWCQSAFDIGGLFFFILRRATHVFSSRMSMLLHSFGLLLIYDVSFYAHAVVVRAISASSVDCCLMHVCRFKFTASLVIHTATAFLAFWPEHLPCPSSVSWRCPARPVNKMRACCAWTPASSLQPLPSPRRCRTPHPRLHSILHMPHPQKASYMLRKIYCTCQPFHRSETQLAM